MKSLLKIAGVLTLLVMGGAAFAQTYKSREPTPDERRRVAGVSQYVEDVFKRDHVPVWVNGGPLFYNVTNSTDGLLFVVTNRTVIVHIVLPNPTNNIGRKFEIIPVGACTLILSNLQGCTFTGLPGQTVATTWAVESNNVALVWSTGTNYAAYTHDYAGHP